MNKPSFTIDEKFIDLMQEVYLSNYAIAYIDDSYGSILEDKEINIIYRAYSNKPRTYSSFTNYDDMYNYIKDKCKSDNTIRHIRFNVGNVIFCLTKKEYL